MSVCTFIASDHPLAEVMPPQDYPIHINIDEGTVDDGGADDNFSLRNFAEVGCYSDKQYGVTLEWHYTEGRARRIAAYIEDALQQTDAIELWHVWLTDYYEYEDSPVIHRQTISAAELTAEDIRELDDAEIFNKPDKRYPERPSFYCLTVTR